MEPSQARMLGATLVYVTHDQEEAMTLGDRVAVMRDGAIEQVGPPLAVYARPANTFVARFIGAPPMNLVPAPVAGVEAPNSTVIGIRPQDVTLGSRGQLHATVDLIEPRGHDNLLHLHLDSPGASPFIAVAAGSHLPSVGADLFVAFPPDRLHLFDERTGARLVSVDGER